MSDKKATPQKAAAPTESTAPVIDLKAYLPEGMNEADLVQIGGLRPIAAPPITMTSPVAGWIVACLDMPPRLSIEPEKRRKGELEPWEAVLIELSAPTKAALGDDIIDVPAGKEVLIPVNGNLKNNRDLLLAAADVEKVFWGLFVCTGQVDLGKPGMSPMWNYEIQLHKQTRVREGRYALHNKVRQPIPAIAAQTTNQLPPGSVMNQQGRPIQSLVG